MPLLYNLASMVFVTGTEYVKSNPYIIQQSRQREKDMNKKKQSQKIAIEINKKSERKEHIEWRSINGDISEVI